VVAVTGRRSPAGRRRLPGTLVFGAIILGLMVLLAVFGPIIWEKDAGILSAVIRGSASAAHPLGTDALGRDDLDRTLVAGRPSIVMAFLATAIAVSGGLLFGATIVLAGRRVRTGGERLIDLMIAYPPIIVALAITAIFKPSEITVVVAIGLAFTPQFARLTNTLAASVKGRDYVTVAHLVGLRPFRLLRRHILPNLAGPLLVLTSVGFAAAIVTISGLSFIGLGVQEPQYDWGSLLALGLQDINVNPIEVVGPALGILLTGLAAGLVGDGLSQYLDPRRSMRRPRKAPISREVTESGRQDATAPQRAASTGVPAPSGPPADEIPGEAAVSVRDLRIGSAEADGAPLIRGVSLDIQAGEILGVVGESGSGKTLTAMAVARLLPPGLEWSATTLQVNGIDMSDPRVPPPKKLATDMGIVFQDPSSCFNPARHVGSQITEVARVHGGMSKRAAYAAAVDRLREVQISSPELRMRQYPHELSGGMRQRAMIAMALTTSSALLIADEPTTALDVTVQAEVLRLLTRLNVAHDMSILLISHDIQVVSALCHRVCVMYAGRIVEELTAADLQGGRVCHPYTRALLAAAPKMDDDDRRERLVPLPGRPPRPGVPIVGCSFASRCPMVEPQCRVADPELRPIGERGRAACHVTTGPLEESLVGD
jgi:peptide/nickel transport system permease protein